MVSEYQVYSPVESEDKGRPLNVDSLVALAIGAISGITYKLVNLKFILLLIHCTPHENKYGLLSYYNICPRDIALMVSKNGELLYVMHNATKFAINQYKSCKKFLRIGT